MPKPKSASQAEPLNNNGLELDPLIDAMLEHLPAPGDYWPQEQRALWMQILDLALKLIYSDEPPMPEGADGPQHGSEA